MDKKEKNRIIANVGGVVAFMALTIVASKEVEKRVEKQPYKGIIRHIVNAIIGICSTIYFWKIEQDS